MTQPDQHADDLTELKARVNQMQKANDAALGRLAQRGIGINVPGIRLDELTEHLLGDMDDPRRLAYEERVQKRFTQIIADAEREVARAQLLQGVNGAQIPAGGLPR